MNKLIVTDLEGIIIDIDIPKCFPAFKKLMGENFYKIGLIGSAEGDPSKVLGDLAIRFEVGEWTENQYLDILQNLCLEPTDAETVRDAWNSMMLTVNPEKYDILKSIRSKTDKFILLSNTNELHWKHIDDNNHLSPYFDDIVLSCRAHCLKPAEDIFKYLLSRVPDDTQYDEVWFADDVEHNRAAAEKLGWRTFSTIEALDAALSE